MNVSFSIPPQFHILGVTKNKEVQGKHNINWHPRNINSVIGAPGRRQILLRPPQARISAIGSKIKLITSNQLQISRQYWAFKIRSPWSATVPQTKILTKYHSRKWPWRYSNPRPDVIQQISAALKNNSKDYVQLNTTDWSLRMRLSLAAIIYWMRQIEFKLTISSVHIRRRTGFQVTTA